MVGLHRAVELPPVDRRHHLVVEPEVVQEHGPRQRDAVVVGDGQLHLGEQVARPALGHQERAALARRQREPKAPASTRRTPSASGSMPSADPGQVQEGEGGPGGHLDPAVGPQQVDACARPPAATRARRRRPVPARPSTAAATSASTIPA